MPKKMWMKLIKKWGEHDIGDDVLFDQSKAKDLMAQGILVKGKPPKSEKTAPKVETATASRANVETAVVTPVADEKAKADAEAKAAKEKAAAEAKEAAEKAKAKDTKKK